MSDGYSRRRGRPDILIEKQDGWPIVIEAEVSNHRQAEAEAQARLGNTLVSSGAKIHAAVALVYSEDLREHSGAGLRNALTSCSLDYVLFSITADGATVRFPKAGWLSGNVLDLVILLNRSRHSGLARRSVS